MSTNFLFDGPEDARVTILLAHGAGAPMDSASMNAAAKALAAAEFRVARFEFGYMKVIGELEAGCFRPGPASKASKGLCLGRQALEGEALRSCRVGGLVAHQSLQRRWRECDRQSLKRLEGAVRRWLSIRVAKIVLNHLLKPDRHANRIEKSFSEIADRLYRLD